MFPILRLFLKSFRRMTRRLSLTLVLIIGLGATPATAQITPNGLGTQVNRDGNTFNIHGGTQAGRNLFHSFYQFGLNQGQIANFWSNPAIANILARVNGGSASYINGLIQVLGGRSNLFLMNPSGIVFGPNASLNVPAAFTATTADRILFPGGSFHAYGENNFANLAGDPIGFAFDRKDPAAIVNQANLTATSVSLVAGQVINTGKVTANQITIAAVPGENLVRLSQAGQILSLEFNPQQAASVADASGNIPITRLPELLTGGGVTTVTANPDQTVTLAGVTVPMSSGTALIGGVLDASNAVANGGQVGVFGTNISLVNAEINASGLTGGGEILIGGEFQGKGTQPNALNTWVNGGSILRADAVRVGDGGRIIVWADGTTKFAGSISAKGGELGGDGGFAEVSGKETLNLAPGWSSRIDLSAPAGKRGTLLLDPNDITISGTAATSTITDPENATDSNNQLLDDDIAAFLENNGDLTIQTTGLGGSGIITIDGDVDITWSAATTFTLNADQSIVVNPGAVIENTSATTGFDAIVFNANAAGTTSGTFVGIEINNATLKANGGNIKLTGKGGDTGPGNYGIYQHSGAQVSTTSGNITYIGTGGNGTNDNVGVFLSGSGTKISSGSGAISITGTGQGTGFNNYGIIQQDSAQVSTTIGNITYTGTGAGTDDAIRTEFGSNIIGDNTSGKITLTSTNNGITLNNVTVKTTNNITINSPGNVTQNNIGGLFADGLELLGSGSYDLTNTNNNISTLAANTSNFIKYTDTDGFAIGTVNSTNGISAPGKNVTLTAGGAVTQSQAITASGLELKGAGDYFLINPTNDVNTLTLDNTTGIVLFDDANALSISGVGTLGAVDIVAQGDITQTSDLDTIGYVYLESMTGKIDATGNNIFSSSGDIILLADTSVTTGDLLALGDIGINAGTSVTTGDLTALNNIDIIAGTSVTTGDLTALNNIDIIAGTSVTTGDLTALNNIDIIAGTSVTTGALDAFLDISITAINGSITVNGDVGFTNLPDNVIFEAFNEITAKDIKAFKNVDLSNPSPLTTNGILTVGNVTTQTGYILLFPLQKLEAGNLTSNGGYISAVTSDGVFITDANGRLTDIGFLNPNGGPVKVGNVTSGGGKITLVSPDPNTPLQAGILDSSGGTGAVFITSGNVIQIDHLVGGTGNVNIGAVQGFKATGQDGSGFSIKTNGGLIDIQYARTGTFTVGTTTGIGTKGKITNGLITLSPNLTFQCFPTDCGVLNNISIRPTSPTFASAFNPPTPRPDLQGNEIPQLTLPGVDTRQLLDVSEVLRTQLDVATEEGIFSLDVAFGAEFANYLGVKPANTLRSAADVRKLLEDIYKQTGRKTAVVYWVLDQLYLNIVLITPGVPQGIAQKQGIVVASVDLTTGLVQQPTTAPLIYRGVPTARRDEVLRVIDRFRSQVTDRRSRDYLKDAQALYRWLIEPIEPELQAQGIDTLLVVPDKGIRLLPLGALYDGKQFLIEKYNVAMTPSVNLISTRYRPLQGAEVLAMGASTFADERSLPSVPIELKTITSIWPGRYFLNQDFTPERLVQERKTGQFRIVHLATHATFKPGDLSESYIVFGNNQKLPVTKLPELSLKGVELFSLGACRTLIGDTTDPTVEFGFAGLAVKTGVETAVASLWNVEDTPTMALMTEFYRYLQKTPIKAEALRQAQLALMQGQTRIEIEGGQLRLVTRSGQSIPLPPELANIRDLDFSHPYFWSGFSMIGSPW